eukprot:963387_1
MSTVTHEIESDETLKVYVKNQLIQLNPHQMLRIQEIIDAPQPSQPIHYNMKSGFVYRFDVNSTWLHSLCGQQKAQTIKTIVEHKVTLAVLITMTIILVMFPSLLFAAIMQITWLLWLLLKHSLLNKTAFKLCMKSFDYWIKMGYAFGYWIVYGMYSGNYGSSAHRTVEFYVQIISGLLSISYIAALDASNTSRAMKLVVSVFGALFCSWWSINFQFFQSEEDWHVIKWKSSLGMHTISTLSLVVSSLRIVTIFLWKQAYKTWKSKGIKAVALERSPTIE